MAHTHQLTIVPREVCPLPAEPTGELAALIDTWSRLVGPVPASGGHGDTEDWVEMAYRLHAAVTAFEPGTLGVHIPAPGPRLHAGADRWVDATTGDDLEAPGTTLPDVGIVMGHHSVREHTDSGALASDYMALRTFFARAGRRMELAGAYTHDEHDVENVIARMRTRGVGRVYVKGRASKTLNAIVEEGDTLSDVLSAKDGAEWILIGLEGLRNTLLVQEWVPMRFEYRIFVVGHQPLTGAGAVVEHTPLDNDRDAFSPLVRERRADRAPDRGGPVTDRPDVVARLVGFARTVAGELAAEVPDMRDYVLDVALGADDQPLVIELNPMSNAGYFACRPDLIFGALASRT